MSWTVKIPALWAWQLGFNKTHLTDGNNYPIFELIPKQVTTCGSIDKLRKLFEGKDVDLYIQRTLTINEMLVLQQSIIANVELSVVSVADIEDSRIVYNKFCEAAHLCHGVALELSISGFPELALYIHSPTLFTGLCQMDVASALGAWIVCR